MAGGFLSTDGPRVWTVPPGTAFLERLAGALADWSGLDCDPGALSDAVIYVPNRRAARTLGAALYRAAGGADAILPPDIRALGDLDPGDPLPGAELALADLPPPMPPGRRLGLLMRLVRAWFERRGEALPVASALAAARDLAALIDQAAVAEAADWSRLPELVAEADLAHHWNISADFLRIVTDFWPAQLAEEDSLDPLSRRLRAAEAVAAHWAQTPPPGPVIVAGSTGATPASRVLMQAVCAVPRGAVVLPGLDRDAGFGDWQAIAVTPSHPQYAFAGTLRTLDLAPADVPVLPGAEETEQAATRRHLIAQALTPADRTGDWRSRLEDAAEMARIRDGLAGLRVIAADDETHEATLAALLLRETLETPGRTAALVTPDVGLARRVSHLLGRWSIDVPPSAGVALSLTAHGTLTRLLLALAADPGDPVALADLSRHPLVAATDRFAEVERYVLRGPRWWQDLTDFRSRLPDRLMDTDRARALRDASGDLAEQADAWLGWLESGLAPFDRIGPGDVGEWNEAFTEVLARLGKTEGAIWGGEAGAALADALDEVAAMGAPLGTLDLNAWCDLVISVLDRVNVAPASAGHPRLAIWGPLEARLQSADRLILAGLNEDVWPQRPPTDGFVPRRFRADLGLPDPEARMGLAAHDFAQLACQPDIVCLFSARREDAPAVESRWIWRLKTLARGALGDRSASAALDPPVDGDPRHWARALDPVDAPFDTRRAVPAPRPPVEARPKRLSVTRINVLQRDPYAIYAGEILRLQPLDPLNSRVEARQRGTAIHRAVERFETETGAKTAGRLQALLEGELIEAGSDESKLLSERANLAAMAAWYVDWRSEGPRLGATSGFEVRGRLDLPIGDGLFTLTAQADRIDRLRSGLISIHDIKTGQPPTMAMIRSGLEQQMPLQALIASEGGFEGFTVANLGEVSFLRFTATPEVVTLPETELPHLIEAAANGLRQLIRAYADPEQPYLSAPRVALLSHDFGYSRLARRDEWAAEVSDG